MCWAGLGWCCPRSSRRIRTLRRTYNSYAHLEGSTTGPSGRTTEPSKFAAQFHSPMPFTFEPDMRDLWMKGAPQAAAAPMKPAMRTC
jgi:hypothetical protein